MILNPIVALLSEIVTIFWITASKKVSRHGKWPAPSPLAMSSRDEEVRR
jgi:hypothetical protein